MRRGKNPFKREVGVDPPARITVGVLNCIPDQSGYFAGQLASLRLCLASLREDPGAPFDLMVVDNGSCRPVRAFLEQALADGQIDQLVLNHRNLGRPNGVRQVLRAATGDLVVYTDGDIDFRPGWLAAHLEVLEAFPDVGMVGGLPIRHLADYYTEGTVRWAEEESEATLETGALIPDDDIRRYYASLGYLDPEALRASVAHLVDRRVTYRGVTAHVGASHMQFLMPRAVIERLPHRRFDRATGQNPEIMDAVLEDSGLLRLATAQATVHHVGNAVDDPEEIARYEALVGPLEAPVRAAGSLWRRWRVRRLVQRIHDWSFGVLYGRGDGGGT